MKPYDKDNGKLSWFCTRLHAGRIHFYNIIQSFVINIEIFKKKNSQCTPYNILSLNLFSSMHDYHMESILGDCKNIWMHKLTKMSDLKKKRGLYQFIVDLDLINNFSKLCNYKCKMLKDMLRTLFKKSNIVTCIWI